MPDRAKFEGEVTATLKSIQSVQEKTYTEFGEFKREIHETHTRVFEKIEDNSNDLSSCTATLESHIGEANRTHTIMWRAIFGVGAAILAIYGTVTIVMAG